MDNPKRDEPPHPALRLLPIAGDPKKDDTGRRPKRRHDDGRTEDAPEEPGLESP